MAIAAQRNKVLDRETNLAVMDFNDIQSNDAYSAPVAKLTKLAESMSKKAEFAESKIKDIMKAVEEAPAKLLKFVQDLMAKIVDRMSKIKLPAFVRNILDKLKSMDLSGFKSFFQRILKVGASLFCNNLDMLLGFFTGYAISKNILSGLLMGLLFSWLNRICSENSKESLASLSPLGRLEAMTGSMYDLLSANEFLGTFMTINRNGIEPKYQNPSLPYNISSNSYLASLFTKGPKQTNIYVQNAEISDEQKDFIIKDSWYDMELPKPTIANVNDNLLSLTTLPKEEKILATSEYVNELGVNFPLTDKDIRDITTAVTGEFSVEEREERTVEVVTTIVKQEGITPELAGMIADLNNPLFTQTDRDLLIESVLEELSLPGKVSPIVTDSINNIGSDSYTEEEQRDRIQSIIDKTKETHEQVLTVFQRLDLLNNDALTPEERLTILDTILADLRNLGYLTPELEAQIRAVANPDLTKEERDELILSLTNQESDRQKQIIESLTILYQLVNPNLTQEERDAIIASVLSQLNALGVLTPELEALVVDSARTKLTPEEIEERNLAILDLIQSKHYASSTILDKLNQLKDSTLTQAARDALIYSILEELATTRIISPDLETMIRDIGRVQLTLDEINAKLSAILAILASYKPIPDKESLLLQALGELKNLPMISEGRREHVISNGNLADKIGNFLKQLLDINLDEINSNLLNEIERSFLEKLKELQKTIQNDKSLVSRDNKTGAWMDVDFTELFPKLSKKEEEYLASIPDLVDLGAHRPLDLHPTSLVLIGEICA
ncbi:hypothetical protein AGENTSMITH_214 [Bacillus phage vB_BspM_AgentSmith]|nr:hypothetical protein AGENTSMITH_214 [Bacillus phage vB_BspM_AgentSmith]